MERTRLQNRVSVQGMLVSAMIIVGLFGPWLTVSYDSYAKLNPQTKMGEIFYHSRVELCPLYGSIYNDEVLVARSWFISPGISLGGLLLAISAALSIFKYKVSWAHFILFTMALLGVVFFFLSVGEGISIGVFTKIGWGIELTGLGLLFLLIVSFLELGRNSVTRFMD